MVNEEFRYALTNPISVDTNTKVEGRIGKAWPLNSQLSTHSLYEWKNIKLQVAFQVFSVNETGTRQIVVFVKPQWQKKAKTPVRLECSYRASGIFSSNEDMGQKVFSTSDEPQQRFEKVLLNMKRYVENPDYHGQACNIEFTLRDVTAASAAKDAEARLRAASANTSLQTKAQATAQAAVQAAGGGSGKNGFKKGFFADDKPSESSKPSSSFPRLTKGTDKEEKKKARKKTERRCERQFTGSHLAVLVAIRDSSIEEIGATFEMIRKRTPVYVSDARIREHIAHFIDAGELVPTIGDFYLLVPSMEQVYEISPEQYVPEDELSDVPSLRANSSGEGEDFSSSSDEEQDVEDVPLPQPELQMQLHKQPDQSKQRDGGSSLTKQNLAKHEETFALPPQAPEFERAAGGQSFKGGAPTTPRPAQSGAVDLDAMLDEAADSVNLKKVAEPEDIESKPPSLVSDSGSDSDPEELQAKPGSRNATPEQAQQPQQPQLAQSALNPQDQQEEQEEPNENSPPQPSDEDADGEEEEEEEAAEAAEGPPPMMGDEDSEGSEDEGAVAKAAGGRVFALAKAEAKTQGEEADGPPPAATVNSSKGRRKNKG